MAAGSCYSCVKYLMFAFNFLFWLLGCAILGIGIWILVDPNFKDYVSGDHFNFIYTGAYIFIAIGLIIMVIGFLGCCGTIRECQWMLTCFFIFLFIIFGLLLGVGIWTVVEKDSLKDRVRNMLLDSVEDFDNPDKRKFMENIQKHGCADGLFDWLAKHAVIIAGFTIGIGVVMVLGMIFSMCLCCEIRRSDDKY